MRWPRFRFVDGFVLIPLVLFFGGALPAGLSQARQNAKILACQRNLDQLIKLSIIYADTGSRRFFPYAGKGKQPHDSMQLLVDDFIEDWKRDLKEGQVFICPESKDKPARLDKKTGKVKLGPENISYAYTGRKLSPNDRASLPLFADDSLWTEGHPENHRGGINVVSVGGHTRWFSVEQIKERGWKDNLPPGLVRSLVGGPAAMLRAWGKSFHSGEPAKVVAFYQRTGDVVAWTSSGTAYEGIDEIRKLYQNVLGEVAFEDVNLMDLKVRRNGEAAWATCRYKAETVRKSDGRRSTIDVRGSFVLRHAEGNWRITFEHFSPIQDVQRAK